MFNTENQRTNVNIWYAKALTFSSIYQKKFQIDHSNYILFWENKINNSFRIEIFDGLYTNTVQSLKHCI